MSDTKRPDQTSDKLIDEFEDKAGDAVDDARQGETEDNPIKEKVRDDPQADKTKGPPVKP